MLFSHSVVSSSSVTPQTVAHQAPFSMGLSSQDDQSGLPFPSPGDLLGPRIISLSPSLLLHCRWIFLLLSPGEAPVMAIVVCKISDLASVIRRPLTVAVAMRKDEKDE